MTSQIHPQLSHCGVYARDIDTMVAFYWQAEVERRLQMTE